VLERGRAVQGRDEGLQDLRPVQRVRIERAQALQLRIGIGILRTGQRGAAIAPARASMGAGTRGTRAETAGRAVSRAPSATAIAGPCEAGMLAGGGERPQSQPSANAQAAMPAA
jgi:hypothetical protein